MFTSAKLRAVEGIVTSKCRDLMERIQEETEKGQLIDLRVSILKIKIVVPQTTQIKKVFEIEKLFFNC